MGCRAGAGPRHRSSMRGAPPRVRSPFSSARRAGMLSPMSKTEIYVSTDVETDGPIPGPHSMLSFGSAAYRADKTLVTTFAANLETLPGAEGHPRTMEWWRSQPVTWASASMASRRFTMP